MGCCRIVLGRGMSGYTARPLPEKSKRNSLPTRIELGVETGVNSTIDEPGRPRTTIVETIPQTPPSGIKPSTPSGTTTETPSGKQIAMPSGTCSRCTALAGNALTSSGKLTHNNLVNNLVNYFYRQNGICNH